MKTSHNTIQIVIVVFAAIIVIVVAVCVFYFAFIDIKIWYSEFDTKSKETLFEAAAIGDVKNTRILIKNGHNINAKNNYGETPLHVAIKYKHIDVVEVLLQSGVDINAQVDGSGDTPLHYSVFYHEWDIAQMLLLQGANENIFNIDGQTPYEYTLENGIQDKYPELPPFRRARGFD